jgi:hypothetical protein
VIDAVKEIKQGGGGKKTALTGRVRKELREKLAFGVLIEEFCEKSSRKENYHCNLPCSI